MPRLRILPQARVDLLEIWHYIAPHSHQGANNITNRLKLAMKSIAKQPGIGHTRADVSEPGARFYSVGNYVIAYEHVGSALIVLRIVHGARDFQKLFGKKP